MKLAIYLIKIGNLDQSMLEKLKINLEQKLKNFNFSFEILQDDFELEDLVDNSEKDQYYAPEILNKLSLYLKRTHIFRLIGVMNKDIYGLGYNFIFGIANEFSGVGLISISRLTENFYKKKELIHRKKETSTDIELRILKDAIHELGHTFGLKHCEHNCIMKFSDSLSDIDKKSENFCASCSKKLKRILTNIK